MDARPFRPRRNENTVNMLHQRHKSTGNLALKASGETIGFRGTAKRAAFGDVTNVANQKLPAKDGAKALKPLVGSISQQAKTFKVAKENAPLVTKAAPLPTVQKTGSSAQSSNTVEDVQRPSTAGCQVRPFALSHTIAEESVLSIDDQEDHAVITEKAPPVPSHSARLLPRHHKSQPDLKVRQQTLRRTQSRVFDRPQVIDELESELDYDRDLVMPAAVSDQELALLTTEAEIEELPKSADFELHDLPSATMEEVLTNPLEAESGVDAAATIPKDLVTPVLSEPEEYWEEEDDGEYDDQDQAFTTAHSFHSRDQTTGMVTAMLQPRVTARVQRELEEAKLEVQRTTSFEDIEEETWDVSMVAEYGEEIFEYMRELENKMLPNAYYMDLQTEIQWSMRSVLMDWLVQVHNRFCLLPETLFLTVNYLDRFLSNKVISIGKLQLAGATAIFLASKYEEINCPSLQEIVYMVDGGYSQEEILKAERYMLSMLNYELGWPGPMSFLRRVSKADDYDLDTRTLAKYFLELTIMDERFVASPPSFLAAGAHCLSRLILRKGDWTKAHVHYSGYTWSQLRPVVTMMLGCCEDPEAHHCAIYKKYSEKRFKEASSVVQQELHNGFALPATTSQRFQRSQQFQLEQCADTFQASHHVLVPIEG